MRLNARSARRDGPPWRCIAVIAAIYTYFLLFAEFAFLELVESSAPGEPSTATYLLAPLALGGITGSFVAARRFRAAKAGRQLAHALFGAAASAGVALAFTHPAAIVVAAAGTGISLGIATVALAAALPTLVAPRTLGLTIGAGTGLAYAVCNVPVIFAAAPEAQTALAAGVAAGGALLARGLVPLAAPAGPEPAAPLIGGLLLFLLLVWLDSAAFFAMQHDPAWKGPTWTGDARLWANAVIHLVAAVAAGWILDRRGLPLVGAMALIVLLGTAALLAINDHARAGLVAVVYPAGVSAYSAALVHFAATRRRPFATAAVFAISGWFGSALGIGMVRDLGALPPAFVVIAGAIGLLLFAPVRRGRILLALPLGLGAGAARAPAAEDAFIARGREVYISEGCIHCHSQYIRPATTDVDRWGPPTSLAVVRTAQPPLLGNRRQGPDLSNVGRRRTSEWHRLHLQRPRLVSPGSRMPSYAHLFRPAGDDNAGEALVAYLSSLGRPPVEARAATAAAPPATAQTRPAIKDTPARPAPRA